MGVSGQRHAPAALYPRGKYPLVPIGQEAGWASEPVWAQRLEEKSSAPVGDRTLIAQPIVGHYTAWATTAPCSYSSRHQLACFKATEGLPSPFPRGSKSTVQRCFSTLWVLSCLHSPGLSCPCCNVVRFCCDLETCNLVMVTIVQLVN
jgi:hypothetical protein